MHVHTATYTKGYKTIFSGSCQPTSSRETDFVALHILCFGIGIRMRDDGYFAALLFQ